jgi:two-component system phosphate regulon sensor histidine kinase PhoR
LVNLLGNAIKYTPEGGRVSLRARVDETTLYIDIEDTGVGISEEELPKVFDRFFRSSNPLVQQESGTGLGLALACEVIRLHGGEITVKSEVSQGSTFTMALPLA